MKTIEHRKRYAATRCAARRERNRLALEVYRSTATCRACGRLLSNAKSRREHFCCNACEARHNYRKNLGIPTTDEGFKAWKEAQRIKRNEPVRVGITVEKQNKLLMRSATRSAARSQIDDYRAVEAYYRLPSHARYSAFKKLTPSQKSLARIHYKIRYGV